MATEASPGSSEPGSVRLLLSRERKLKVRPCLLFWCVGWAGQQSDGLYVFSTCQYSVTVTSPSQVTHKDSCHGS